MKKETNASLTELARRNVSQIIESQSDVNRYYFWLKYKRQPKNNDELLEYYILGGGASDYAKRNQNANIKEM